MTDNEKTPFSLDTPIALVALLVAVATLARDDQGNTESWVVTGIGPGVAVVLSVPLWQKPHKVTWIRLVALAMVIPALAISAFSGVDAWDRRSKAVTKA